MRNSRELAEAAVYALKHAHPFRVHWSDITVDEAQAPRRTCSLTVTTKGDPMTTIKPRHYYDVSDVSAITRRFQSAGGEDGSSYRFGFCLRWWKHRAFIWLWKRYPR